MKTDKVAAYIGFAIKSNSIIWGADNLYASRKHKHLIIACSSIAANTLAKIKTYAATNDIRLVTTLDILLENIVHKTNCKLVTITSKQLTKAILDNINNNYTLLVPEDI